jgi:hypothetical protein
MRLGTRNQAIPQAVRPPEGRAGIPLLVPVFRNAPERVCSGAGARNDQPGRMQSLNKPDWLLGALRGQPPLEGVGPHAVGPRGRHSPHDNGWQRMRRKSHDQRGWF